jgi:DNA invertase Pin-like site-specific DNA recombinase
MTMASYRPWAAAENKIRPEHRDRAAVVYVRQSSRQQVLEHTESTRLQYALVDRAAALGWARSRIMVIDDDLGRSAALADGRPGFQKLVTEVTMGRVGLVVGIEMSRLARTGREWHQLLELCSLSGTLLADPDGVYDPGFYNDRLLLGLKGTMSEAELFLIRQRMFSGRLAKAERGELAFPLPIGYLRRADGAAIVDPDEAVQHVVRLVFDAFARLGTLNAMLRYLVDHHIRLPVRVRCGIEKGQLQWRRPSRATLQLMLHNPIYAGYYAYGRRKIEPSRKVPGRPSTGRVVRGLDECWVAIPDRMPAYISVAQYEANLARLNANRNTAATPGAARDGAALLGGLLRCGRCNGQRMVVGYHDGRHGYTCVTEKVNYGAASCCQHISGGALDAYVTDQVLAAIAPAAIEVSLRAAEQVEAERAELDTLWRHRVERAEQAADRARRQYQLVEPENRLVARSLEHQWETALADLDQITGDYQRFHDTHPRTLTAVERDAIGALTGNLSAVWAAPTTTHADRKDLLRILIEQVTATVMGTSELVDVTIRWAGGHETTGRAVRPVARFDQLSYYPQLIAMITDLAGQGLTTPQIADRLNTAGMRPPKRVPQFSAAQIIKLFDQHDIPTPHRWSKPTRPDPDGAHEWSVARLAAQLRMPTTTIHNWIYRGWVTARKDPATGCWVITADEAELARLREQRGRPAGWSTRRRFLELPEPPDPDAQEPR